MWVSAVISAAALVAAAIAIRIGAKALRQQRVREAAEQRERDRPRLREQAALVSTWIEYPGPASDEDTIVIGARVRNGSQTPVYQARLTMLNVHDADKTVEHLIPVIPPGSDPTFYQYGPTEPHRVIDDSLAIKAELVFTDSSGERWARDKHGRLVQLVDTLRLWADGLRTPVLRPFAENFSEPLGIRVTPRRISIGDLQPELLEAHRDEKGTVPDLVVGVHDWIGNLVRDNVLDPIYLSEQRRQAFQPLAINAVTYQGRGYGIPYAMENVALFRNTVLVPEAPQTFEELVEVGLELRRRGQITVVLSVPIGPTGDAYHFHPLFTAAGGPALPIGADPGERDPSAAADLGFSSPASIAAFTRIAELGERGRQVISRTAPSEIEVFTKGKAAFVITGPWALAQINKSKVPYEITPIPAFAGLGPARVLVGVSALFIPRRGPNRQVAHDFLLNYLTRTDLALSLFEAENRPPALNLAAERLGDSHKVITAFAAAATSGVPMPSWPESIELFGLIGKAEAAVVGGAPVESTVASLAREVQSLMTRGPIPRPRTGEAERVPS